MAQTYLVTNIQAGNREDLIDFITRISWNKTPFKSKIGTGDAKGIKHEWMTQALRAGATNSKAEGFAPSFAAANQTARVRRSNQVQLMANPFSVSNTQEFVDKAGLNQASEYDEQKRLKFEELALDMDFDMLQSVLVARDADAGTASAMDGLLSWPVAAASKDMQGAVNSQDSYNALTQVLAEAGADPDTVIAAGFQRRMISSWTTPFKKFELADGTTKLTDTVEEYQGDFGVQRVVFDKQMPTTQLAIFEIKYLKAAYLRPAFHFELGQTIDGRRGYVGTEVTLEVLNPLAIAKMTNLAVQA